MKSMEDFQSLVKRSQDDTPPRVDVSAQVMAEIRLENRDESPASNWLLYGFTAVSSIAAVLMGIASLNIYQQVTDPFVGFLVDISRIMQ